MFTIFQQVFGFRWPIHSMYQDFMKFWCLNPDWLVVSNLFIFHFIYGMSSKTYWRVFICFKMVIAPPTSWVLVVKTRFVNPWLGRLQLSSSGTPGLGSGSHSRTWLGPQWEDGSTRFGRVRWCFLYQMYNSVFFEDLHMSSIILEDLSKIMDDTSGNDYNSLRYWKWHL